MISKPRLRSVSRMQGNNAAIKRGEITLPHYELEFEEVPVLVDAFRRMVREQPYDVSEMAVTTYLCAKRFGKPFTALPIFLVRGFHHGTVLRARGGDIDHPKQLEGRRVGVNRGYTVTTGVWARGVLAEEYGVDLSAVTWMPTADDHVTEFVPPDNVVQLRAEVSLSELLRRGEIDAIVGVESTEPDIVPLLPAEAGYAALLDRGHYPVNHLIVVRDELLSAHPDLAGELMDAFEEAKNRYVDWLRAMPVHELARADDRLYKRVMDLTGTDPLPYGMTANRTAIEELIRHAQAQGILPDELTDPATLFAGS